MAITAPGEEALKDPKNKAKTEAAKSFTAKEIFKAMDDMRAEYEKQRAAVLDQAIKDYKGQPGPIRFEFGDLQDTVFIGEKRLISFNRLPFGTRYDVIPDEDGEPVDLMRKNAF